MPCHKESNWVDLWDWYRCSELDCLTAWNTFKYFQHRRCYSSYNSLNGITHPLTHSHFLLIKPIESFSSLTVNNVFMHTCHCLSNCKHGSVSSASSDSSVSSLCAVLPPSMMVFFVNMSSLSLSLFEQLNFKSLGRDEKVIQQTFIFFTANFRRLTLMPTADQVIQETFTLSDWN